MGNAHLSTANYPAVIADLRAKRDELDRTIALLEAMAGISAPAIIEKAITAPVRQPDPPTQPKQAPPTPVRSKDASPAPSVGIGEACAKVLREAQRALSTREVTDRVLASGFEINTASPVNNVWSALSHRMKVSRDVAKSGRDWVFVAYHKERSLADERDAANRTTPNGSGYGHSHQSSEG